MNTVNTVLTCLLNVVLASAIIAITRRHPDKLIDAAEECDSRHYPWDEFAAFDSEGNELIHCLDPDASLRAAAAVYCCPLIVRGVAAMVGSELCTIFGSLYVPGTLALIGSP